MNNPSYEERDKRLAEAGDGVSLGDIYPTSNNVFDDLGDDLRSLLSEAEGLRASRATALDGPRQVETDKSVSWREGVPPKIWGRKVLLKIDGQPVVGFYMHGVRGSEGAWCHDLLEGPPRRISLNDPTHWAPLTDDTPPDWTERSLAPLHGRAGEISTPLEGRRGWSDAMIDAFCASYQDAGPQSTSDLTRRVKRARVKIALEAALAASPSLGGQGEVGKDKGLGVSSALALDDQCQAEIERLRKALEHTGEIGDVCVRNDTGRTCPYCQCGHAVEGRPKNYAEDEGAEDDEEPAALPNPPSAEERS